MQQQEVLIKTMVESAWQGRDRETVRACEALLAAIPAGSQDAAEKERRLSALHQLALSQQRLGQLDAAWKTIQKYQAEAGSFSPHTISAMLFIAQFQRRRGEYLLAENKVNAAGNLAEVLDDVQGKGDVLYQHGRLMMDLGNYDECIVYLHEARDLYRSVGNERSLLDAINDLAIAYHYLGHYEQAIAGYREGLVLAQKLGTPWAAMLMTNLGECFQDLFAFGKAREMHQAALDLLEGLPSDTVDLDGMLAEARRNLGVDLYMSGERDKGREFLAQALAHADVSNDLDFRQQVLFNLIMLELDAGDLDAAKMHAEELSELAARLESRWYQAAAHFGQGWCFFQQQDRTAAAASWQNAQKIAEETGFRLLQWRVRAARAQVIDNDAVRRYLYKVAADIIQHMAQSVGDSDLRQTFLAAPEVVAVLQAADRAVATTSSS